MNTIKQDDSAFTAVYRGLTQEEVKVIMRHPKSVWLGWCHAPYERDAALAEVANNLINEKRKE